MISTDHEYARSLASRVVARLGDAAPPWHLLDIGYSHGVDPETSKFVTSDEPSDHLLLTLGTAKPDDKAVGVYFTVVVPRPNATAATAEQIQDHALELTHGALLPPCPDHHHPLQISLIDGVACWECPQDRKHYVEPVMPDERT